MRLFAYLEEALDSLRRNRMRSMLTMLGMIIGSASIVTVFAVSDATTSGISSRFKSFGQAPIIINVDSSQNRPSHAQIQYRDLNTVRIDLGDSASEVMPLWQRDYQATLGPKTDYVSVTDDGGYHSDELIMAEGRKVSFDDVATGARVAAVTQDLVKKFLGDDESAVGKIVRVNGDRYEIIGVYASVKGSLFNSLGAGPTIVVPYTTFHNNLEGGPVDMIAVYPADPLSGEVVGKAATAALQHVHGERAQYQVQDSAELLKTMQNAVHLTGIGLSAIGGIALIVAGIGIMNIMLVSVNERTREIGIRKSIGASRNDIIFQFLLEAIVLSLAGGVIGMSLGLLVAVGAVAILNGLLGELFIPYLFIVTIALLFSLLIGTIFGTYPAMRAADLDPVEALRS